jgi:peptidoglycan hydrolase CwlO-like protein
LRNVGSETGLIICPKCGHEQEERLDCRKCGIIFSKYYALFPSSKSAASNGAEESIAQVPTEQNREATISDMQMQLREISARFANVEFEKAERNQLRADLKNLERQLHDNLESMENRLDQFAKRFEESSVPAPDKESGSRLAAILERLEHIEGSLQNLDHFGGKFRDLDEKNRAYSQLMLELQMQHSALRKEVADIKSQLELLSQAQESQEPETPLEIDVHAIRKYLDELRDILSTASRNL